MTEYYEEKQKVKNLGNLTKTYIDREQKSSGRVRSISPVTRADRLRSSSPKSEATLTTTTYETTKNTKYKQYADKDQHSRSTDNYQQQQQKKQQQQQQRQQQSSIISNNYQSSSNQNINQNYKQQSTTTNQSSFNQQQQQQQIKQKSRASNATHELDDLMASLDDFKVNDHTRHVKTTTKFTNSNKILNENPEYAIVNKNRHVLDNQQRASSSTSAAAGHKGRKEIISTNTTTTTSKEIKNIDNLENIIGSIEIEMNKQGLETLAKGSCYSCQKAIVGQVITALGRTYHPGKY